MAGIKTVCAWCQKVIVDGSDDRISHGICSECMKKHFPETDTELFERTQNLYEFWQAGGKWTMDQYIKHLLAWEKNHPEVYAEVRP